MTYCVVFSQAFVRPCIACQHWIQRPIFGGLVSIRILGPAMLRYGTDRTTMVSSLRLDAGNVLNDESKRGLWYPLVLFSLLGLQMFESVL